jgi:hypothetical protein
MPITTYPYINDLGGEGRRVTLGGYTEEIIGTLNEFVNSSSVTIPFGRVVVDKPNGQQGEVQLPSAASQVIVGVSLWTNTYEKTSAGVSGYPSKSPITIMRKGVVIMIAEEALAVTDTLFFRHTAATTPDTYDAIGRIRNDAQTDKASQLTGARLLRAAVAGGPAYVLLT